MPLEWLSAEEVVGVSVDILLVPGLQFNGQF